MAKTVAARTVATNTTSKKTGSTGLAVAIFAIVAILVLITAASAWVVTLVFGDAEARQQTVEDLRRSYTAHTVLQQQRFRLLAQAGEVLVAQDERTSQLVDVLRQLPEERDLRALLARFEEDQSRLGHELTILLGRDGRVVLRSDAPSSVDDDFSATPLIAKATAEKRAHGVMAFGDDLYQVQAALLARDFDLAGYLVVGSRLGRDFVADVQRTSGAPTAILRGGGSGPELGASTLDAAMQASLEPELRGKGDLLQKVLRGGQTVDAAELELAGKPWMAFLAPLRDPADAPIGAVVTLQPMDVRLAGFQRTRLVIAGVAGGALLVGFLLSFLIAAKTMKPAGVFTGAAQEVARGNLDVRLPVAEAGRFRPMAEAMDRMIAGIREQRELASYLAQASRFLPEPTKTETAEAPQAGDLALAVIEMRRFANSKIAYDPGEHLGRYARDLQRMATAVRARGGTVAAILGHRMMATFAGEDHSFRALTAATEILLMLSTRENAFDEPVPPVVALAQGSVVHGTMSWGGRSAVAVAGLTVQKLESMLREATPGEIYMSREVYQEIAPRLQQAGLQARSQRGLVSPQPMILLQAADAQKLTGAQPPKPKSALAEEQRDLADVAPGVVLASRFEVEAELGSGPHGAVFKVQVRDRGDLLRVKILRPDWASETRLARLTNAIRAARSIQHPNLLPVLDLGQADGLTYTSCTFVRGMSLRQLVAVAGRMPASSVQLLARQLCAGLAEAHRLDLCHGGLKPEDVLIEPHGVVRVMDFGFTGPVELGADATPVPGAAYLAPEVIAGQEPGPASDVYGVGVLLLEMLAGQPAFRGTTPAEVRGEQARPPAAPGAFAPLVQRCLDPAPERRFPSCAEVLRAFDALSL